MIYNVMTPELIEINSIKNIEYIKFYDLTTNDKDKIILLPALLISYDNGKTINLCIKDKYFKEFVYKVIEVYNNEKDKPIETESSSPLLKTRNIQVDQRSKVILDNANIDTKESITSFYKDKDRFDNSLVYEQDEIKSIIDITRFAIMDFAKFANINVELSDNIKGYRTNYIIEGKINDLFVYLLVHYNKVDDNQYIISIGNMGGANKPLIISISFTDNSIRINSKYQNITITNEYNVLNQKGTYLKEIFRDGEIINFDTGDMEQVQDFEYRNLLYFDDETNRIWYKLPWGAYLGEYSYKEKIDTDSDIYHSLVSYIDINDDNFTKREIYTKKLERRSTNSRKSINLTLDEFRKITFGYEQKPYYIIETHFKNARGDGEYQQKYNGKYFYHITKVNDLSEITKDNLKSVRREIINDQADLLSDEKLKKIGGKR